MSGPRPVVSRVGGVRSCPVVSGPCPVVSGCVEVLEGRGSRASGRVQVGCVRERRGSRVKKKARKFAASGRLGVKGGECLGFFFHGVIEFLPVELTQKIV